MIRIHKSVLVSGSPTNGNAIYYIEGACVAADENDLPTEGIAMGSKVWVVDDATYKYFNEVDEQWA